MTHLLTITAHREGKSKMLLGNLSHLERAIAMIILMEHQKKTSMRLLNAKKLRKDSKSGKKNAKEETVNGKKNRKIGKKKLRRERPSGIQSRKREVRRLIREKRITEKNKKKDSGKLSRMLRNGEKSRKLRKKSIESRLKRENKSGISSNSLRWRPLEN
jgi:hypothetical protein